MDSGNLLTLLSPAQVGGTWVWLYIEWDIWDVEERMLIHLTDAPPTSGGSGLNVGLQASRWEVRMSSEDTDQRGLKGFRDRPWLFHSRRTTKGPASALLSYSVSPGSWRKGKEGRWEAGTKSHILRQPCKVSHFSWELMDFKDPSFFSSPVPSAPSKLRGIWAGVEVEGGSETAWLQHRREWFLLSWWNSGFIF